MVPPMNSGKPQRTIWAKTATLFDVIFAYSYKSFAALRLCVRSSSESDFRIFGYSVIRLFG
jgi:hypothetical protein